MRLEVGRIYWEVFVSFLRFENAVLNILLWHLKLYLIFFMDIFLKHDYGSDKIESSCFEVQWLEQRVLV